MNIDPRQIIPAAAAGVKLLGLDTTLIPGNIKAQVVVLESVLMGIAGGTFLVVPKPQPAVELDPGDNDSGDKKEDDNGDDNTDQGSGEEA